MREPAIGTPQGNVTTRSTGLVQTRLTGPVECRAYTIAGAIRLGNVTLVITDRLAAMGILEAALIMEEVATRLGPTYQGRFARKTRGNDVTALVEMRGAQQVGDLKLKTQAGRCGEASLTLGSVRVTACDSDSAGRVAKALADGYDESTHRFTRLKPFADHQEARDNRRIINKARRAGHLIA